MNGNPSHPGVRTDPRSNPVPRPIVRDLGKRYRGARQPALRGVTAEFEVGVTVLVGPNGAGKTTLLRILGAILAPTTGAVLWRGRPVDEAPVAYRDVVGYLPQDFLPYEEMSSGRFLSYIAALKGIPRPFVPGRVAEVLRLVGLEGEAVGRPCRTLSHGQVRRLGLAQALLNDPQVLLLDEPTAGIDPEGRLDLLELVRTHGVGKVVILSTHTLADAGQVADRIACLDNGRLTALTDREAFVGAAAGRVLEGIVTREEGAVLQSLTGTAVTERVPVGEDLLRIRLVALPGVVAQTAGACIPRTGGNLVSRCRLRGGLAQAEPGLEDAYVYHRLASGTHPGIWAAPGTVR